MNPISLSTLTEAIQTCFDERFAGQSFWINAEISDVKKQPSVKRCYLKFIERTGSNLTAELRAVFWSTTYDQIDHFEKNTQQNFTNGLKIICLIKVRYHQVYGLNADVLQIDIAHTLGTIELERKATLERLLAENSSAIRFIGESYITLSNSLPLPMVLQRIALITAPNSDGQRDFIKELEENKYGYQFKVQAFLCTIQGDQAHLHIAEQLATILQQKEAFDIVAIVRGGGSQTDFAPFEKYDLARQVALFPLPVFTGIGHDRNISIVDLMARSYKTPTKVAAFIVDYNFEFENRLLQLKDRLAYASERLLASASQQLQEIKRLVKMASPTTILNKGFAIIKKGGTIIANPESLDVGDEIAIQLKDELFISNILKKDKNEERNDIQ